MVAGSPTCDVAYIPAPATPVPSDVDLQTSEETETTPKTTGEPPKTLKLLATTALPLSAKTSPQMTGMPQAILPKFEDKEEIETPGTLSKRTQQAVEKDIVPRQVSRHKEKEKKD